MSLYDEYIREKNINKQNLVILKSNTRFYAFDEDHDTLEKMLKQSVQYSHKEVNINRYNIAIDSRIIDILIPILNKKNIVFTIKEVDNQLINCRKCMEYLSGNCNQNRNYKNICEDFR